MSDANYISRPAEAQVRDVSMRLVAQTTDEDVYSQAADLLGVIGSHLPDEVPGRFYVIWGVLTDAWELESVSRPASAALMREAAGEFLALHEDSGDLDAYLTRWNDRLGLT
jgi:hypothetical protein